MSTETGTEPAGSGEGLGQFGLTPSATVGPYLAIGLTWDDGADAVAAATASAPNTGTITLTGRVFDGAGAIVPDGLVETWQADPDGRFDHPDDPRGSRRYPGFRGFARSATDAEGRYRIRTLKPGSLPAEDGQREAPLLDVSVFARGMLNRVITRIYFPDEDEANAADPVLRSLDEPLRQRLIATATGPAELAFDIRLQGEDETPFFQL